MFYSPSTRGFYAADIHAEIPADAVEVDEDRHRELMLAQAAGKAIVPDEQGHPVAVDRPEPKPTAAQQIAKLEAEVTPRRLREAALGTDAGWLAAHDAKIAAYRSKI